jgi:Fe2+ or Zn2+ uptake regulation protein
MRRPHRRRRTNGQADHNGRPAPASVIKTGAFTGLARARLSQPGALVCERCGRKVAFADGELERLQDEVARMHGFVLLRRQHELHGLCDACQRPPPGG